MEYSMGVERRRLNNFNKGPLANSKCIAKSSFDFPEEGIFRSARRTSLTKRKQNLGHFKGFPLPPPPFFHKHPRETPTMGLTVGVPSYIANHKKEPCIIIIKPE